MAHMLIGEKALQEAARTLRAAAMIEYWEQKSDVIFRSHRRRDFLEID